jgi:hypothetical protein
MLDTGTGELRFYESAEHLEEPGGDVAWERWHRGVTWCEFLWPADGAAPAAAGAAPSCASRRVQRRRGPLQRAARRLAEWRHRRYAARPLEREARDVLGVPWRYPENLTRELPEGQEEDLAALADELDLDQVCAAVITELRGQEGQQT